MAQEKTNRGYSKDQKEEDKVTFDKVKQVLAERAAEFAEFVVGEKPTSRGQNSIRFYPRGSLVVTTGGRNKGTFYNFSDESQKGSMIDLWMTLKGGSAYDALMAGCDFLGMSRDDLNKAAAAIPPKDPKEEEAEEKQRVEKRLRTARWLWDTASNKDGREEGLAYLRNRGIHMDPPPDRMRFRKLTKEDLVKMNYDPALIPDTPVTAIVLRATNAQGDTTAVQQILTAEGVKLSKIVPDIGNVKKTNGELTGSAVKFGDPKAEEVILAEGPETAMSIHAVTGKAVWVTLGTSNYTTLQIPRHVKRLLIAADIEPWGTGMAAAIRAKQHWEAAGVPEVGIAIPPVPPGKDSSDFNDVLQDLGPEALIKAVSDPVIGPRNHAPGTVCITPDPFAAIEIIKATGIDVIARVPGANKDGKRWPMALDLLVEDHHTRVLVVPREGYTIVDENLRKARPDLPIETLAPNSMAVLDAARTPGAVLAMVARHTDLHAPSGIDGTNALAFCLRRADADALHGAGHKAVAVRSKGIDALDLSFMKGRKAILCPMGNGTEFDDRLEERLQAAGAQTTRLVWQLFKPEGDGFAITRARIPDTYGAAEAVSEGWKGERMVDLLKASESARRQVLREKAAQDDAVTTPASAAHPSSNSPTKQARDDDAR